MATCDLDPRSCRGQEGGRNLLRAGEKRDGWEGQGGLLRLDWKDGYDFPREKSKSYEKNRKPKCGWEQ